MRKRDTTDPQAGVSTGSRSTETGFGQVAAQPRHRADRPTAMLLGTLRASRLGGGSSRALGPVG